MPCTLPSKITLFSFVFLRYSSPETENPSMISDPWQTFLQSASATTMPFHVFIMPPWGTGNARTASKTPKGSSVSCVRKCSTGMLTSPSAMETHALVSSCLDNTTRIGLTDLVATSSKGGGYSHIFPKGCSDSQGIIFRVLCLKQGIQFHSFVS